MAYTIQINSEHTAQAVLAAISAAVKRDGCFVVNSQTTKSEYKARKKRTFQMIYMERIRLTEPKEYCGNHPGPCIVNPFFNPPKRKYRFLEWDDWVAFHDLVNDVLDTMGVDADVWTRPQDAAGKFYMRRGKQRRLRYEYDEEYRGGRTLRIWNLGTPDQFT